MLIFCRVFPAQSHAKFLKRSSVALKFLGEKFLETLPELSLKSVIKVIESNLKTSVLVCNVANKK